MAQTGTVQRDGAQLKAMYAEAVNLQKLGNDEEALKRFAAILQKNANIAEVHFQIARIFLNNDRLEKALRHIRAAAKLRPGVLDPVSYTHLTLPTILLV